jgi:hypothetical protein
MVADGEIERIKRGVYGLPGTRAIFPPRGLVRLVKAKING